VDLTPRVDLAVPLFSSFHRMLKPRAIIGCAQRLVRRRIDLVDEKMSAREVLAGLPTLESLRGERTDGRVRVKRGL
jgi:hypothetical protein